MMRNGKLGVVVFAAWLLASGSAGAHSNLRTRNVVLIVSDGLRWQEVFDGPEVGVMNNQSGGVSDPGGLRKEFLRQTPEESRQALMPFFWTVIARQGQLYGNRAKGSTAQVSNGLKFSYPGYNEMLVGYPDPRINRNGAGPNPNVTVFEWLNRMSEFHGRVAAFATWSVFTDIFNGERSGIYIYAGWNPVEARKLTPKLALLQELRATTPQLWEGNIYDSFLQASLKEHIPADRPRVLFVGYGETDEWAHSGRYDLYLRSAHHFDQFVADLWNTMQSLRQYKGKTTFVITTDHGRGRTAADWKDHGRDIEGAEEVWIAVLGPDTPPLGERARTAPATQGQVAATVAALLGKAYRQDVPAAAPPLPDATGLTH
ncbi:MAG: alkaline phosphatase family protein [Acidobacteriia bacterium]|nr:alkaline phosphatase family protein [Terriglobia bacterium]